MVRSRLAAYAGLAFGGGLGLVASAQPWWRAVGASVTARFSGTTATSGLSQILPAVILVGALLTLVLRSGGRRLVGVLLALAAAGMVATGALRPRPTETELDASAGISLADSFALQGTAWPVAYAGAGLAALAAAAVMVARTGSWPGRSGRFDRPATGLTNQTAAEVDLLSDPADAWRAMDAGVDPTLGRAAGPKGPGSAEG